MKKEQKQLEQKIVKALRPIMIKRGLSDQTQTELFPHIATAIDSLFDTIKAVVTAPKPKTLPSQIDFYAHIVLESALKNSQVAHLQNNKQESIKEVSSLSKQLSTSKELLSQLTYRAVHMSHSARSLILNFRDQISHGAADDLIKHADACQKTIDEATVFVDEKKALVSAGEQAISPAPESKAKFPELTEEEKKERMKNFMKGLGIIGNVLHSIFGDEQKRKSFAKRKPVKAAIKKKK